MLLMRGIVIVGVMMIAVIGLVLIVTMRMSCMVMVMVGMVLIVMVFLGHISQVDSLTQIDDVQVRHALLELGKQPLLDFHADTEKRGRLGELCHLIGGRRVAVGALARAHQGMDHEALAGDLPHEILLRNDGGKHDSGVTAFGGGTRGKERR
jgi:hypothetical protein